MRIRLSAIVVTAVVALALGAAPALANHSWGSYHWARTANPFPLQLGDNMSAAWDEQFTASMGDWNRGAPDVLALNAVTGSGGKNCKASSGRVEVCNGKYGFNGWLGLAQIWISGSHIVQGVAKMNDSYLVSYGTVARQHVLCQEVGHSFGLDHQDESGADLNTCMDYDDALSNPSPNKHDYDQLALIYSHTDSFNSYTTEPPSSGGGGHGKGNGNNLERVSDDLWVEDLGNGRKRFVFVFWAQRGVPHGPPAGA